MKAQTRLASAGFFCTFDRNVY